MILFFYFDGYVDIVLYIVMILGGVNVVFYSVYGFVVGVFVFKVCVD